MRGWVVMVWVVMVVNPLWVEGQDVTATFTYATHPNKDFRIFNQSVSIGQTVTATLGSSHSDYRVPWCTSWACGDNTSLYDGMSISRHVIIPDSLYRIHITGALSGGAHFTEGRLEFGPDWVVNGVTGFFGEFEVEQSDSEISFRSGTAYTGCVYSDCGRIRADVILSHSSRVKGSKRVLFVSPILPEVYMRKGLAGSYSENVRRWELAGYDVATATRVHTPLLDSVLLRQFDVVQIDNIYRDTYHDTEKVALSTWISQGGSLFINQPYHEAASLLDFLGFLRVDGQGGGSTGLNWQYSGAPLLLTQNSGPNGFQGVIAAECMDRLVLSPGFEGSLIGTHAGYPIGAYGDYGEGTYVAMFASTWNHDQTYSGNAYRSNIFLEDNIAFLDAVISYLSPESGDEIIITSPTLLAPDSSATSVSVQPTFQWSGLEGAETYTFQLGTDAAFTNSLLLESGLSDTTWTMDPLDYGTLYHWRVRGVTGDGVESPWSSVWSFTTEDAPPAPFFEDTFSGDLSKWEFFGGSWFLQEGTLFADYGISCGSVTCAHAHATVKAEFQPPTDQGHSVSVDFIRTQNVSHSIYYAAYADIAYVLDSNRRYFLSIGYGNDNWTGVGQTFLDVDLQYWNGSWSHRSNTRVHIAWDPNQWNTFRLDKIGDTATLYLNGTLIHTITDALFLEPAKVGLHTYGTKRLDNFRIHLLEEESANDSLVAEYRFNGDAADSGPYSRNGTTQGAVLIQDRFGESDRAFLFDGVDDYIRVEHPILDTDLTQQSFTTSYWFKPDQTITQASAPHATLVANGRAPGELGVNPFGQFEPGDGRLSAYLYQKVQIRTQRDHWSDRWYHLAYRYNHQTGEFHVFVDGEDDTGEVIDLGGNLFEAFGNWYFGGNVSYEDGYFKGSLDDIRFHSTALTESAILELFEEGGWRVDEDVEPDASLILHLAFNGDLTSATSINHIVQAADSSFTNDRTGAPDAALRLNGVDAFATVANTADFPASDITIRFWFNRWGVMPSGLENYVSKEGSFQTYMDDQNRMFSGFHTGTPGIWSTYETPSLTLDPYRWYSYTFTFDSLTGLATTYIDSVMVAEFHETDPSHFLKPSELPLFIGRNGSQPVYFVNGLMDELRIYNRALTAAEIATLHAGEAADLKIPVFPGDVNRDFTVDVSDILNIGLLFGQTGITDNAPGNAWQPFQRRPWPSDKGTPRRLYADTNGDGVIDERDVEALALNYLRSTDSFAKVARPAIAESDPLVLLTAREPDGSGWRIRFRTEQPSDLYGLSLRLILSPEVDIPPSVDWSGSVLPDAIRFQKWIPEDRQLAISLGRTDGRVEPVDGELFNVRGVGEADVSRIHAYRADGSGMEVDVRPDPTPTTAVDPAYIPLATRLQPNYPNPFNPSTVIQWELAEEGDVRLTIHDLLGREIAVLVDDRLSPGVHSRTFEAATLASGMYLIRLTAGGQHFTRKMVLMK